MSAYHTPGTDTLVTAITCYTGSSLTGLALELESLFYDIKGYPTDDDMVGSLEEIIHPCFHPLLPKIDKVANKQISTNEETEIAIALFLLNLSPDDNYVKDVLESRSIVTMSEHVENNINRYYEFLLSFVNPFTDTRDFGHGKYCEFLKREFSGKRITPKNQPYGLSCNIRALEIYVGNRSDQIKQLLKNDYSSLVTTYSTPNIKSDPLSYILFDLCCFGLCATDRDYRRRGPHKSFNFINDVIANYKDRPLSEYVRHVIDISTKLSDRATISQVLRMPFHNVHMRRYAEIDKLYADWKERADSITTETGYADFSKDATDMLTDKFHAVLKPTPPNDQLMFILMCDSSDGAVRCENQKKVFNNFLKKHGLGEAGTWHHILESIRNMRVAVNRNFVMQFVYDLFQKRILKLGSFLHFLDDDGVNGISLNTLHAFITSKTDQNIGYYRINGIYGKYPNNFDIPSWRALKPDEIPKILTELQALGLNTSIYTMRDDPGMPQTLINVQYAYEFQHLPSFTKGEDSTTWYTVIENKFVKGETSMYEPAEYERVNQDFKLISQYYEPSVSYSTSDATTSAATLFTDLYNMKFYNITPAFQASDVRQTAFRSFHTIRQKAKDFYTIDGERMTDKVFHEDTILIGLVDNKEYAFFAGDNPLKSGRRYNRVYGRTHLFVTKRSDRIKSMVEAFNNATDEISREQIRQEIQTHNQNVENAPYARTFGGTLSSDVALFIKVVAAAICIIIIAMCALHIKNAYNTYRIRKTTDTINNVDTK